MKLLELFSGTGSVGCVAKNMGWTVVSLDLKGADINCEYDLQSSSRLCRDILQWKYKKYPVKYWDMIWASPPCVEYGIAKQTGVRKIEQANEIVMKTLEIIKYFKPRVWFIENPQTGLLKKQPFMEGLPFFDIDYCKSLFGSIVLFLYFSLLGLVFCLLLFVIMIYVKMGKVMLIEFYVLLFVVLFLV